MENKKIKSVKLAEDYRTVDYFIPKGTILKNEEANVCDWEDDNGYGFSIEDIIKCKTGLFEIEYEPEIFALPKLSEAGIKYCVTGCGKVDTQFGLLVFSKDYQRQGRLFYDEIEAMDYAELERSKYFINKLADWCDYMFACSVDMWGINDSLEVLRCYKLPVSSKLMFKSYESARLFLEQINLPENEEHKNNLIKILKSGRL